MDINVLEGHVALILLRDEKTNAPFYLQIPLNIINVLCLSIGALHCRRSIKVGDNLI